MFKNIIENVSSKQITLDPELFLFAAYPEKHSYTKHESTIWTTVWKSINRPSATQWLNQMLLRPLLEKKTKQNIYSLLHSKSQTTCI